MILVDTSAWVEFLRDTDSPVCNEVDRLLGDDLAVTDPIVMEVLAGAKDDRHLHNLRGLLARATLLHCEPIDYGAASGLYRTCRRQGLTVRKLIDCLIAAVAVRHDVPVLHADKDFDVLEAHTALLVHRPSSSAESKATIMGPMHPGEILANDFLKLGGISPRTLAISMDMSPAHIAELIEGRRSVTPAVARALGRFFNMSEEFWLSLQARYDQEARGEPTG